MVNKWKSNPFAKKYKQELAMDEILDNASQVKSWSRYDRARIIDTILRHFTMVLLGILIGGVITRI